MKESATHHLVQPQLKALDKHSHKIKARVANLRPVFPIPIHYHHGKSRGHPCFGKDLVVNFPVTAGLRQVAAIAADVAE